MKARRVVDLEKKAFSTIPLELPQQGDYEIKKDKNGQRWFWVTCPGPCRSTAALALRPLLPAYQGLESWELHGTEDCPTLSPSINHVGCWHGWLRQGEFTSC